MTNHLSVQNLSCERGEQMLFENLNFQIRSGEVLQVRGLNGSGKTSLLRMLAGLAFVSEGEITWNHKPIHKVRDEYYRHLNYIGHKHGFKDDLTAKENLKHLCVQSNQSMQCSLDQALDAINLGNKKDLLTRDLSAGQRRRVALAKLLLLPNPLWILDEPFTAIDKDGVAFLIQLMQQHTKKGGMIIFTSHQDIQLNSEHMELSL